MLRKYILMGMRYKGRSRHTCRDNFLVRLSLVLGGLLRIEYSLLANLHRIQVLSYRDSVDIYLLSYQSPIVHSE